MMLRSNLLLSAVLAAASLDAVTGATSSSIYGAKFTSDPIEEDIMSTLERCESELTCAGVSFEPNGTVAKTKLYQHSFVGPYKTEKTYETQKDFTYHRGRITGGRVSSVVTGVTLVEAKELCKSDVNCVAFSYPVRSLVNLTALSNVTLYDSLTDWVPDEYDNWRTYVSNDPVRAIRVKGEALEYDEEVVERPYRGCCKGTAVPAMKEVIAADTLERIPCDISREEFFLRYEAPRKPVMLVGCEKDWPAVVENKWLLENLISRFGNNTRWRARIGGKKLLRNEDYHHPRWGDIVEAMLTNKPYYVFDKLYDPEAKSIDDDYEDPLPVKGGDLYSKLPYFDGPLRWFCIGPRNTGTSPHMDPYGTDAWNTLLKGHKWWIIYPKGFTDEDQLECEPSCSVKVPITAHWYAGVGVNAARTEYPLDKYAQHVLQHPGETIYIPDGLIHSVYNYDETIAITKNYASAANLDEVWMETVTSGDPLKVRMMYYYTLNSEQRRRVRSSQYWPPLRHTQGQADQCQSDIDDEMAEFPMFDYNKDWEPNLGETVEALYQGDDDNEYGWYIATVITKKANGMYNVIYKDNDIGEGLRVGSLRMLPKVGDIVEAQFEGTYNEWYKAIVIGTPDKGHYNVKYIDDGVTDLGLPRTAIREYNKPRLYEMVHAKFIDPDDDEEYWVDSIVIAENDDGTYDVRHSDGLVVRNMLMENLRRAKWEFKKGDSVLVEGSEDDDEEMWFRGRITKARDNGRYDIKYLDGDTDYCISWRSIRWHWADDVLTD